MRPLPFAERRLRLEAFVAPDRVHGTVVQLAQTDLVYPSPAELLATRDRPHAGGPSTAHASEPSWWLPVWEWRRAVAEDTLLRGWRGEEVVRLVDMVWDGSKKSGRRREVV